MCTGRGRARCRREDRAEEDGSGPSARRIHAITTGRTRVVFIHGLWLRATSWHPGVELFRDVGYEPIAPGWPGDPDTVEAARANPGSLAGHGIICFAFASDRRRHHSAGAGITFDA